MSKAKLTKIKASLYGLGVSITFGNLVLYLRSWASRSTGLSLLQILTTHLLPAQGLPHPLNLADVDGTRPSYMRELIADLSSVSQ